MTVKSIGTPDEFNEKIRQPKLQLKTRLELPPPTEREHALYQIIDRGYNKMDTAARASSRYLHDKLQELRQRRLDDGMEELDAGDLTRTFDPEEFNKLFWRYAQLTIDEELIKELELNDYHDQIMELRIKEIFGPTEAPATRELLAAKVGEQVYVGSDNSHTLSELRKK